MQLTRRQQDIYDFLVNQQDRFEQPPTLDELCEALQLASRGSLHKHIQALVQAGLVEPMEGRQRGIRLIAPELDEEDGIPFLGAIAAGRPIEVVANQERMKIPDQFLTRGNNYILRVKGDSMIDEGILEGDYAIIESCDSASNGQIVVALIEGEQATLKRLEQLPQETILHPANAAMESLRYAPDQVCIQGVLVGLMRQY